jgi:hypothetical protein
MDFRQTGWWVVDYIYLAQERKQWQTLLLTVINFGPQATGAIYRLFEKITTSQDKICSMELVG